jgi:hypothetical protein
MKKYKQNCLFTPFLPSVLYSTLFTSVNSVNPSYSSTFSISTKQAAKEILPGYDHEFICPLHFG